MTINPSHCVPFIQTIQWKRMWAILFHLSVLILKLYSHKIGKNYMRSVQKQPWNSLFKTTSTLWYSGNLQMQTSHAILCTYFFVIFPPFSPLYFILHCCVIRNVEITLWPCLLWQVLEWWALDMNHSLISFQCCAQNGENEITFFDWQLVTQRHTTAVTCNGGVNATYSVLREIIKKQAEICSLFSHFKKKKSI